MSVYNDNIAVARYNSDGSLDTTFNGNGKVTTDFFNGYDFGSDLVLQNDNIIVGGYTQNIDDNSADFALVRYNTDGSLDASFGSNGKIVTDFGNGATGQGMALQQDNNIVLVGDMYNQIAIARYNADDGSLDISFDTDGKLTINVGSSSGDVSQSIAIRPDGKIIAGGQTYHGQTDFTVMQYNNDGSLDTSFATGGIAVTSISNSGDNGQSIALQNDGKIIIVGSSHFDINYDFGLIRYNSDGSLDSTFGSDGKVYTTVSPWEDIGNAVTLQNDGKIVMAGSSVGNDYDIALVRYNSDGSLDSTFSNDGMVRTNLGFHEYGYDVVIQNDGRILVAGNIEDDQNPDFIVARYDTTGNLDASFGTGGIVRTDFSNTDDYAKSIVVETNGKITVVGSSGTNIALARYMNSGSLDSTFSHDGKVITSVSSHSDVGHSLVIQEDSKLVVTGSTYNGSDHDIFVARYESDGLLDTTFDNDGSITIDIEGDDKGFDVAIQDDDKIVIVGESNGDFLVLRFLGGTLTHVENLTKVAIPKTYTLYQNYPNPFNPATTIEYSLPHSAYVQLAIYNIKGQLIRQLVNGNQKAANHRIVWDSTDQSRQHAASGVYFYSISATSGENTYTDTKPMILLR